MTRDPYHTDMTCGHDYGDDRDRIDQRRGDERPRLGPDRQEILDALTDLTKTDDPTENPDVSTARVLEEAEMIPVSVEDLRVVELSIERGQTGIGAGHLCSYDHISDYVVEYDDYCEQCDRPTRHRHVYHTNHNIAGYYETKCKRCSHPKDKEEWY